VNSSLDPFRDSDPVCKGHRARNASRFTSAQRHLPVKRRSTSPIAMVRRAPFGFRSAVPQPSGRLGRGRPSRQLIDQRRETPQARPPPHAPEHRHGAGREGQTAQTQFPSRTSGVTLGHTKESSSAEALRPHPDSNPGAPRDPGACDEARAADGSATHVSRRADFDHSPSRAHCSAR
jgi:hypothetical protein